MIEPAGHPGLRPSFRFEVAWNPSVTRSHSFHKAFACELTRTACNASQQPRVAKARSHAQKRSHKTMDSMFRRCRSWGLHCGDMPLLHARRRNLRCLQPEVGRAEELDSSISFEPNLGQAEERGQIHSARPGLHAFAHAARGGVFRLSNPNLMQVGNYSTPSQ